MLEFTETVTARLPSPDDAGMLQIAAGTVLLVTRRAIAEPDGGQTLAIEEPTARRRHPTRVPTPPDRSADPAGRLAPAARSVDVCGRAPGLVVAVTGIRLMAFAAQALISRVSRDDCAVALQGRMIADGSRPWQWSFWRGDRLRARSERNRAAEP